MNDHSEEPEVSYRRLPKNLRSDRPPSALNLLTTSGESQLTRMDENDILSSKGGSVPRQDSYGNNEMHPDERRISSNIDKIVKSNNHNLTSLNTHPKIAPGIDQAM